MFRIGQKQIVPSLGPVLDGHGLLWPVSPHTVHPGERRRAGSLGGGEETARVQPASGDWNRDGAVNIIDVPIVVGSLSDGAACRRLRF